MSFQLFDRIRAFTRSANLYRVDNIYQDQGNLGRFLQGNEFININSRNALLEQTNLSINRLERYKDYAQMDEVGPIFLALDLYADEASLRDPESGHSVTVKAKRRSVKKEIEDFLYNTLMIDREIRKIVRSLVKYGDFASEIIPTVNRDGVAAFRYINIYNFTRIQTKFGDLVGYFFQDENVPEPVFLHPWQAVHFKLTSYENIYEPYGRSILDGARKAFKRLRLMEDAALIYRITRAPEKRIFTIDVGNIPTKDIPEYMELIARQFKRKRFVDASTGELNERYSPLIQEDDFFLPKKSDGTGPSIDTLSGAENLDKIADIVYFLKQMIAPLKIPFHRVGIGGEDNDSSGRSLASQSPDFAKAIQWIQDEVIIGLKKLVLVHLMMKGFSVDDLKNFELRMTAASAIDELYRMETWKTRIDVINAMKDTGLFTDEYIVRKFTDMTDDEIREQKRRVKKEKESGQRDEEEGVSALEEFAESVDEEEKELFLEYEEFKDRSKKSDIINEWCDDKYHQGFDKMLSDNEFSGLENKDKDNNAKKLIVESVITEEDIKEAKKETKDLLIEEAVEFLIETGNIVPEDVPKQ